MEAFPTDAEYEKDSATATATINDLKDLLKKHAGITAAITTLTKGRKEMTQTITDLYKMLNPEAGKIEHYYDGKRTTWEQKYIVKVDSDKILNINRMAPAYEFPFNVSLTINRKKWNALEKENPELFNLYQEAITTSYGSAAISTSEKESYDGRFGITQLKKDELRWK